MDSVMAMVTTMVMDDTVVTAIEGGVATQGWGRQWMAQLGCNGNDGDGQCNGDGEER